MQWVRVVRGVLKLQHKPCEESLECHQHQTRKLSLQKKNQLSLTSSCPNRLFLHLEAEKCGKWERGDMDYPYNYWHFSHKFQSCNINKTLSWHHILHNHFYARLYNYHKVQILILSSIANFHSVGTMHFMLKTEIYLVFSRMLGLLSSFKKISWHFCTNLSVSKVLLVRCLLSEYYFAFYFLL